MIIYLARNRVNGKAYVGKTKRSLEQRVKEHVASARAGCELPLGRAIRKHGPEAFDWSVLVEGDCTDEELDILERDFIEQLGTYRNGYNATLGGDGVKGLVHSAETRARMSAARRGEKNPNWGGLSEEHKKHLSESKMGTGMGPRPHMRGRKLSADVRAKIGLGSARPKVAIPVRQLDTEGNVVATYDSVRRACQAVNAWPYGIKACCEGRRKSYAGFGWTFAKE